jgi:large subunit ribosomal protein L17
MLRRNLISSLFRHDRIKTTEAKAKAIQAAAEKMITLARNRGDVDHLVELAEDRNEEALLQRVTNGQARRLLALVEAKNEDALKLEAQAITIHAQRLIAREITDREVMQRLFRDIAPRYANRPGGYTRIARLGLRKGDAAPMVMLSLVEEAE